MPCLFFTKFWQEYVNYNYCGIIYYDFMHGIFILFCIFKLCWFIITPGRRLVVCLQVCACYECNRHNKFDIIVEEYYVNIWLKIIALASVWWYMPSFLHLSWDITDFFYNDCLLEQVILLILFNTSITFMSLSSPSRF